MSIITIFFIIPSLTSYIPLLLIIIIIIIIILFVPTKFSNFSWPKKMGSLWKFFLLRY
jgi:hypothetical protein